MVRRSVLKFLVDINFLLLNLVLPPSFDNLVIPPLSDKVMACFSCSYGLWWTHWHLIVSSLLDFILIWGKNVRLIWGQNYVQMYGPSTRYLVLFRIIFNEFVLALVVINTILMNSKYKNIGLYISPFLHVYDICVAQSSCGNFWSGKCIICSHNVCQHKLSIIVKTLLCISCTYIGVGLCYCLSFSAYSGRDE